MSDIDLRPASDKLLNYNGFNMYFHYDTGAHVKFNRPIKICILILSTKNCPCSQYFGHNGTLRPIR